MTKLTIMEVTQGIKTIKQMISRKRKINNNPMDSSKEKKLIICFSLTILKHTILPNNHLTRIMM